MFGKNKENFPSCLVKTNTRPWVPPEAHPDAADGGKKAEQCIGWGARLLSCTDKRCN